MLVPLDKRFLGVMLTLLVLQIGGIIFVVDALVSNKNTRPGLSASTTDGQVSDANGEQSGQNNDTNKKPTSPTSVAAPPQNSAPTSFLSQNVSPPTSSLALTGYLGCSMTRDAVNGYHVGGGTEMWERIDYSAGVLTSWQVTSKQPVGTNTYWQKFATGLASHPGTDSIWWNLCLGDDMQRSGTEEDFYQAAVNILNELRKRVGTMPIYASSTPEYENPARCKLTTPEGPARTQRIIDRLVDNGLVAQGPIYPKLLNNQLADDCHPNAAGQASVGNVLRQFF
ncbi:hypothetical protein H0X10_03110 [Candidatus Saccharibacteria bacterium]|nr:hypothetical protein [Candidatus Saccharibacteria bacterium]